LISSMKYGLFYLNIYPSNKLKQELGFDTLTSGKSSMIF